MHNNPKQYSCIFLLIIILVGTSSITEASLLIDNKVVTSEQSTSNTKTTESVSEIQDRSDSPESRTNHSFKAIYKHKPIPSGPDAFTWKAFNKKQALWVEKNYLKNYQDYGKRSKKWNRKAKDLLKDFAYLVSYGQNPKLLNRLSSIGDELEKLRCNDPIVAYVRGTVFHLQSDFENAAAQLENCLAGYEVTTYPRIRIYHAAKRLAKVYQALGKEDKDIDAMKRQMMHALGQASADTMFTRGNQRYYWLEFINEWHGANPSWKPVYADVLLEAIKNEINADLWIRHMAEGKYRYHLAWKTRGSGYSSTVKAEAWKSFKENIATARSHLTRAHDLHADFPEAATFMIRISMADGGKDIQNEWRSWFDKAVAAQFDYLPAYNALLWALQPRWGGSHDEMYDFGVECLNTERFDTEVPRMFVSAVWGIRLDLDDWKDAYKWPGAYEKFTVFYEEMQAQRSRAHNHNYWLSAQAMVSWAAGEYEAASKIFDKLGDNIYSKIFTDFSTDQIIVVADIELHTGPYRDDYEQAEQLYWVDYFVQAMPIYKRLLKKMEPDSGSAILLQRRIATPAIFQALANIPDASLATRETIRKAARSDQLPANAYQYSLRMAAENGYSDLIQQLILAGADFNNAEEGQLSPLRLAAYNGQAEVVRTLIDAGADVNTSTLGYTALYSASKQGHLEVVQLLLQANANVTIESKGYSSLWVAARYGHADVVQLLLASNANINEVTIDGHTALYSAAYEGHSQVVSVLLKAGANIDKTTDGLTALYIATLKGHLETVKMLIDAGADIDRSENGGYSLLRLAAYYGLADMARVLIDAGADVDKTSNGYTALFTASEVGHIELVQTFLDAGANVNSKVGSHTVLSIAEVKGHTEIVELLKLHGAKK